METTETLIFARALESGGQLTAHVQVTDYGTLAPTITTIYRINGEIRASGNPIAFHRVPRPGYTHYVNARHDGKRAGIVLQASEVALIATAEQAALDAWYTAHPAFVAEMARKRQRANLVEAYRNLIDEQRYEYERLHRRGDPRAMPTKLSYESKIAATLQAIHDFDAAQPEGGE